MRTVIVYDIGNDAVRLRVANCLGEHGSRVQESVFECVIAPDELAALVARLQRLIEPDEAANVRIYRQCGNCWPEAIGIGRHVAGEQEPCTIV